MQKKLSGRYGLKLVKITIPLRLLGSLGNKTDNDTVVTKIEENYYQHVCTQKLPCRQTQTTI